MPFSAPENSVWHHLTHSNTEYICSLPKLSTIYIKNTGMWNPGQLDLLVYNHVY
jgi:hypothetical protein